MAFKIFISYSTKDLQIVNQVQQILKHSEIEVFVAEYSVRPSEPLGPKIEEAIKNCNLFILLWSENSKISEWVPQEIGLAKAYGKTILPLILHKNLDLPGFIKGLKYIDAVNNPQEALIRMQSFVSEELNEKIQDQNLMKLLLVGLIFFLLLNMD